MSYVFVPNWSVVHFVLLDFGGGASCCSCDRGKTKSGPVWTRLLSLDWSLAKTSRGGSCCQTSDLGLTLEVVFVLGGFFIFVKLQSKLNSPVQVGQGFDFVFPLSQEQQQQEKEEPSPKYTITKCTTDLKILDLTHHPKDSHPSNSKRSLTLAQPSL